MQPQAEPVPMPARNAASGPLVGVKILDFSELIAAPLATMLLSDMGAEVLKIEPIEGEAWRINAQFMPGESRTFMPLNRGKRDIAVNLKAPEGQAIIHRLVADYDVAVLNYRPDVPVRLGIDYATLSAINPRLIYAWNTAFGRTGPQAHRTGYDLILQAMSGLMSAAGRFDERGLPVTIGGSPVVDVSAGLTLAWAVCAALYAREQSGLGQQVDTSLFGAALTLQAASFYSIEEQDAQRRQQVLEIVRSLRASGRGYQELVNAVREAKGTIIAGSALNLYYRVYQTSDDFIAVACLSLALRRKFLQVIGLEDPRLTATGVDLKDPNNRALGEQLVQEAEAIMRSCTGEEWLQRFDEAGVPSGPVRFGDELFADPHVVAGELVLDADHHAVGPVKMLGLPIAMSRTPLKHQGASPGLGQHTDAVLRGAGYDDVEIRDLRGRGVVR